MPVGKSIRCNSRSCRLLLLTGFVLLHLTSHSAVIADEAVKSSPRVAIRAEAAKGFVDDIELTPSLRKAIVTVLRQNPDVAAWSGQDSSTLFAISAEPLPPGRFRKRGLPTLLKFATASAVSRLLQTKSLLSLYESHGLDESNTLRKAVLMSARQLNVQGSVKSLTHLADRKGEFVVAIVYAPKDDVSASLFEGQRLSIVKAAYRETMHAQARRLMKAEKWLDALGMWRHLHERTLVSPELYLDAARCFQALKRDAEATEIVGEAIDTYEKTASWTFFEQAGEISLKIDTPESHAVAERAYTLALAKYRSHGSPPPTAPEPD